MSSWEKKQNGGWKLSDTDWFYFSFYNPSCFFYDPSWSESYFILFSFFYSIWVGPSQSEWIRPGLAVRVDPVRLLYLPGFQCWKEPKEFNEKNIACDRSNKRFH